MLHLPLIFKHAVSLEKIPVHVFESLKAAMVKPQLATAMRPAEVCLMRPCDVVRTGDVWVYEPSKHKTEHKGKRRIIPLGPKAQEILTPFLLRGSESFCFSPAESMKRMLQSNAVQEPQSRNGLIVRSLCNFLLLTEIQQVFAKLLAS